MLQKRFSENYIMGKVIIMDLNVEKKLWCGAEVVSMQAGGYEAMILPSIGGNLLKLIDITKNIDILRNIEDLDTFEARPGTYGIPVLFPPNRIDRGKFSVEGKGYQFPINEPDKNNSLHGFLEDRPWVVTKMETKDNKAIVELTFDADENTDFYKYYPHHFVCINTYELSEQGMKQTMEVVNKSATRMPFAIGYHTAFNLEFNDKCKREDSLIRFSVKERIELTDRLLPTEKYLELDENEAKFRTDGQYPLYTAMDNHYNVQSIDKDGEDFHGLLIENREQNIRVVYEVGSEYKHWMIWNNEGLGNFVCVEPQTWMINSPNLSLPKEKTGYIILDPEQVWKEETKIFTEFI